MVRRMSPQLSQRCGKSPWQLGALIRALYQRVVQWRAGANIGMVRRLCPRPPRHQAKLP